MEGLDIMIEMYLQGKSVIDIAEEFQISREAVYLRLRKLTDWDSVKQQLLDYRRSLKDMRAEEFIIENRGDILDQWKRKHKSCRQIAREWGIKRGLVSKIVKEEFGTTRRKYNEERDLEIRRLYSTGDYTQTELGKRYSLPQPVISRIINH